MKWAKIFWTRKTLVFFLVSASCARAPLKDRDQALRPTEMPEALADDLGYQSLQQALEANIEYLKTGASAPREFGFGPRVLSRDEYLMSLEYLLTRLRADPTGAMFQQALRDSFEPFEVYGQKKWGEVFMTSYFEPVIDGSLKPTSKFSQPLYERPKDMVEIEIAGFFDVRPALEQRSSKKILRGRLLEPKSKDAVRRVVVYPDREAIDSGEILSSAEALVYVDPIDAFILEIQGSGVVRLKNGKEIKVGYSAQNGHPYVPIGKHLFDVIPKEKMSLGAIEAHLRSLPLEEARKIMQLNPSYVFFREVENRGISYLGTEVVDGRTIATDRTLFPKGALAFLQFERPEFSEPSAAEPAKWTPSTRFVLDQDTGGAIRGPGRLDLFAGRGPAAKQFASVMKNNGRLIYFVPKADLVASLRLAQPPMP